MQGLYSAGQIGKALSQPAAQAQQLARRKGYHDDDVSQCKAGLWRACSQDNAGSEARRQVMPDRDAGWSVQGEHRQVHELLDEASGVCSSSQRLPHRVLHLYSTLLSQAMLGALCRTTPALQRRLRRQRCAGAAPGIFADVHLYRSSLWLCPIPAV